MRKRGSIVCKLRPYLPKGPTNSARMRIIVTAAIFANGTYFVDTPHITLFRSKLDYASVVWNNLTSADSDKVENILGKFASLCYHRFIQPHSFCNYESMLNYLHFKKLYSRRQKS
jgi:hypothetical protein